MGTDNDEKQENNDKKQEKSTVRKIVEAIVYLVGCLLISGGLAVLIWIVRPYVVLYLMPSAKASLEKKVENNDVYSNYIIIPSVLVDAPIYEGLNKQSLKNGVARETNSGYPGKIGNCVIQGHNLAEFGLFKQRSFFSLLELIKTDAPVYIFYKGKKYEYKVIKKSKLDVSDSKIRKKVVNNQLTLVTCVSTWSVDIYTSKRTVVVCKLVKTSKTTKAENEIGNQKTNLND